MGNITRIAAEQKSYNCLEGAKLKITLKAKLTVSEEQHRALDRMAFASTKLWNTANRDRRQKWEQTGKIPNYYEQENILKDNPWHKRLPHHSAQAVLQKLDQSYRSWFMLRKTDTTSRPPGFKPKIVEIMYSGKSWFGHIVQEVEAPESLPDTKAMAIDMGIVNIASCVTEYGNAEIIDGGQLSSVWRYFNKQIGKVQTRVMSRGKKWSDGLSDLTQKRSRQTKHILHAASNKILEFAINTYISTIIVGDLKNIRKKENGEGRNIGKNNQKLHSWSFNQFTQMLSYKAARAGISVKKVSERNSSKTCSVCGTVRKSNRIHRGLYRCKNCGAELNADVNGARNILKMYLESLETGRPVVAHLAVPLVRRWNGHAFC